MYIPNTHNIYVINPNLNFRGGSLHPRLSLLLLISEDLLLVRLVVFLAVDTALLSKMTPIGVPPYSHILPTKRVVFFLRHILHPFRRGQVGVLGQSW